MALNVDPVFLVQCQHSDQLSVRIGEALESLVRGKGMELPWGNNWTWEVELGCGWHQASTRSGSWR